MENRIKKSARVCGIFASGMIAGVAASMLTGKSRPWFLQLRKQISSISIPKILPAIPEFDKEVLSIDVETHLSANE